jgi:hypothetical protein
MGIPGGIEAFITGSRGTAAGSATAAGEGASCAIAMVSDASIRAIARRRVLIGASVKMDSVKATLARTE